MNRSWLLAMAFLTACGSSASSSGSTSGGSSGGTISGSSSTTSGSGSATGGSGGSGASSGTSGATCASGSHASDGGCVSDLAPWASTSALQLARDHHVTFTGQTTDAAFVFVAGGVNNQTLYHEAEQALIYPDGGLGAFVQASNLPKALLGMGLAQWDARTVVMAGGLNGFETVGDTVIGAVSDDGGIAFSNGPLLGTTRYHLTLTPHGGYVYAIGGLEQSTSANGTVTQALSDAIERAPFDGITLGAFEALTPLPTPLTHHAAVVWNDGLYVIGGVSNTSALSQILRADFNADGTLGAFTQVGSLPEARATSAAFVFLDQLFVVAGGNLATGGETDTVLRAPMLPDGSVGAFQSLAPLPRARVHAHQAPVFGDFVFSAAGSDATGYEREVFASQLQ